MRPSPWWCGLVLALAVVGCSESHARSDAGEVDATSARVDAGRVDEDAGIVVSEDAEVIPEDGGFVIESDSGPPRECDPPGLADMLPCGNCGELERVCTDEGRWTYGSCAGEGECAPGTEDRSSTGCAPGQVRRVTCDDACTFRASGLCTEPVPVDVMLLFQVRSSNAPYVIGNRPLLASRLVAPLLAMDDVAVGASWFADFPISPHGADGDRPFEGGVEPTRDASAIDGALARIPEWRGGDLADSGIEALSILSGGAPPPSALPLSCSDGRVAGGCWRDGAQRVVVVYADVINHNGPDPNGAGLFSEYHSGILPSAATWPTVRARMADDGTILLVLHRIIAIGEAETPAQYAEMLSDLGQPASDLMSADVLEPALDAVVARVRAMTLP